MARADALVLFGITGDLSEKKLIPALYELTVEGRLDIPVVGVARSGWTLDDLCGHIRRVLADRDRTAVDQLCSRLRHVDGDYQDPATFAELAEKLADEPGLGLPIRLDHVAGQEAVLGTNTRVQ